MKKLKMSNRTFRKIWITLLSIFTVILVLANVACNAMASTLDTYVGKGGSYVVNPDEKSDWNTSYYDVLYETAEDAEAAAYATAKKVAEEGSILFKNNGILPLSENSNVMPFGAAYLNPIYGQLSSGGSAKWVVDPVTPEEGLYAFTINNAAVECMNKAGEAPALEEAEGTTAAGSDGNILGGDCKIYEYAPAIYDGLEKVEDTTAMVFITRSGQENLDMKHDAYEDGTPHYLALSQNEKETIRIAKETCGKVVVVLVTSAPMELGDLMSGELEADAILWVAHPGEKGMETLSDLLTGVVNPSGRSVDIYPRDFTKDPTYVNIGEHYYSNLTVESAGYGAAENAPRMYIEYQEGVYMGYRYYETADFMDDSFVYGELDNAGGVVTAGSVCYPFGYGLSYTTFAQELVSVEEKDGTITATVTVTNTGNVAGKDVVQLYYTAPYTDFDIQNKIEKPVVNLIAFDKTEVLESGKSQTLQLTFAKDDMASYCYTHENPDGTIGCYVLEEGAYNISLRANSHDVIATKDVTQAETIWYDGSDMAHIRSSEITAQSVMDNEGNVQIDETLSGEDYVAATNQFQTSSDYMNTDSVILSRADWLGTQPTYTETKEISQQFADQLGIETSFDVNTDPTFGNVEGSLVYAEEEPTSNANNGLKVSDMRGLAYDDPKWDLLLDQIDWTADKGGIIQCFAGAAYATGAIESIGLPETVEMDGVNGLKVGALTNDGSGYDMSASSSFGFAPLMAATWNEDLLYEVGKAFGQESLQHGINGWYAPAINLHRSLFSGRVFEYYSEDPVLSGVLAASAISGAGDQGMFCYVKHFALNDIETGRASLANSWADEQTMRELYLKAFEIAVEDAVMTIKYIADEEGNVASKTMRATTTIMAAQNCVGTTAGEVNYALLTKVLREEWGFQGTVISDYWVWNDNSLRDLCIRTGCDTYLCMHMPMMWTLDDYDSPTARTAMRNAIHNLAYTVANSNRMQGIAPGGEVKIEMSPWMRTLIGVDVVGVAFIALIIFWMVRRAKDEKLNPDKYKPSVKKSKKKVKAQ